MRIVIILSLYVFVLITGSATALAQATPADIDIRESNRCSSYFAYYERQYNIPPNLLRAISITESGIRDKSTNTNVPWPWAVNHQGKGYYFKSKQEAVHFVKNLLRKGQDSVDVGCMQINLHYHPKAFENPEQAFEPKYNINYAASFLQGNFQRLSGWRQAVAAYHSETPEFGTPYARQVLALWQNAPSSSFASYKFTRPAATSTGLAQAKPLRTASVFAATPAMSKQRRTSNIFIKVRQKPTSYAYYQGTSSKLVENISQNALRNFTKSKAAHSVTIID